MTLHIPPEFEAQLREAATNAGYTNVGQFVVAKILGENQHPPTGTRLGGQWKGQVLIADDFNELPDDLREAFGMTGTDESTD